MSEVDVGSIDLMVFFGGGTPNVGVVSECCHAPQRVVGTELIGQCR